MDYPTVKELLLDFDLNTKIKIIDNTLIKKVHFEGQVYNFFNSKIKSSNLLLVKCDIEDNTLIVRATLSEDERNKHFRG